MSRHLALFGLFAVLCPAGRFARADEEEKAGPKDNTPPPGFKLLFNGKDLEGWQGLVTVKDRAGLSPDELKKRQEAAVMSGPSGSV